MYNIYCVQYSAGFCGTDIAELVVAESEDKAVEYMYATAQEWAESFADDEDVELEVDIGAELYNPDKHDGIIFETAKDIRELQKECATMNSVL